MFWSKPKQLIKSTKTMKYSLLSLHFLLLLIIFSVSLPPLILHHRFFCLKPYPTLSMLQFISLFLFQSYFDHKNYVAHYRFFKLLSILQFLLRTCFDYRIYTTVLNGSYIPYFCCCSCCCCCCFFFVCFVFWKRQNLDQPVSVKRIKFPAWR